MEGFEIPDYLLPIFSNADDAGVSTGGNKNTLFDTSAYWTPGIWQGALLIVSINGQKHVTIISDNTEQSLSFPAFPSNDSITQNSYCIKRLPPAVYRPGIVLTAGQSLIQFVYTAQDLVAPTPLIPWMKSPVPHGGHHTAAPSATVLTDAAANWAVNSLVGMRLFNTTDHSYGDVISNTANTVTVAALAGGTLNAWSTGDAYVFGVHLVTLGFPPTGGSPMPYTVTVGETIEIIEQRINFTQDGNLWIFVDGLLLADAGSWSGGEMIDQSAIVAFGTELIDPNATSAHLTDLVLVNRGLADMIGGITITCLLEAV